MKAIYTLQMVILNKNTDLQQNSKLLLNKQIIHKVQSHKIIREPITSSVRNYEMWESEKCIILVTLVLVLH